MEKLGLVRDIDLALHLPMRYEDETRLTRIADALEGDTVLRRALSPQIVETFLAVKRFEIERHRAWVSDWEIAEYLHHL